MNGWGGPDGSHPEAAECQYRVWMGLACMHACRGSGGGGASMNGSLAATVHKVVGTGMLRLERCLQERPRGGSWGSHRATAPYDGAGLVATLGARGITLASAGQCGQ